MAKNSPGMLPLRHGLGETDGGSGRFGARLGVGGGDSSHLRNSSSSRTVIASVSAGALAVADAEADAGLNLFARVRIEISAALLKVSTRNSWYLSGIFWRQVDWCLASSLQDELAALGLVEDMFGRLQCILIRY